MRSEDRQWFVLGHLNPEGAFTFWKPFRNPFILALQKTSGRVQILMSTPVVSWVKVSPVTDFPLWLLGNSSLTASVKVSLEPGLLALSLGSRSEAELLWGPKGRHGMIAKATLWRMHFLPAGREIKSKVLILIYSPNLLRAFKHYQDTKKFS